MLVLSFYRNFTKRVVGRERSVDFNERHVTSHAKLKNLRVLLKRVTGKFPHVVEDFASEFEFS